MLWLKIISLLLVIQIGLMGMILVLERRRPAKAMAWALILWCLPLIGMVLYYLFARNYRRRRLPNYQLHQAELRTELENESRRGLDSRFFNLLRSLPDFPVTMWNRAEILDNASGTYRTMMNAMRNATHHIHIEIYIIRNDAIGQKFQTLWMKKAHEGVKVRLLIDGVGSHSLDKGFKRRLQEAGVEIFTFLPVKFAFFSRRVNYRNHRKIVIVDGHIGFTGGMNIGNEYLGADEKLGFWRDTDIRLEGDSVSHLQHIFLTDWSYTSGQELEGGEYFPTHTRHSKEPVQLITSGPDDCSNAIQKIYFSAIVSAKRRIWITSPYFIPDPGILSALKIAALSGIDVRVLIPSIADSPFVHWATLSFVQELLQAGVHVYQYQAGFIHAKTMIVDHVLAVVGTANMDMRSFYSNFELNILLFSAGMIARVEKDFLADLEQSGEIPLENFANRSVWQKSKEGLARMLSPLL